MPTRPLDYEVSHGRYAPRYHVPAVPRIGRKKALLIGINYSSHPDARFRLKSGVRNAQEMKRLLLSHSGFEGNNIRILTDDQPENIPTKDNIRVAMHWLVEGAEHGDTPFFYFSGHTARLKDVHENVPIHEGMCAMEYMGTSHFSDLTAPGIVVDDDMHNIMVKSLPSGCRLTAILDCCSDGTLIGTLFFEILNSLTYTLPQTSPSL